MSEIVLRPATRRDAADLAILDNIAGHGISNWFWQGAVNMGKAEDAYEWGRSRLANDTALYGWKNTVMAESDGEVVGCANGYIMPRSAPDDEKNNPLVFAPVFQLFALAENDWLLDCLSVYSHARNRGVAGKLLDDCFTRARKTKADHFNLVAEDSNQAALALYTSHGFSVQAQQPYIPFNSSSKTQNWLLLSAPLN